MPSNIMPEDGAILRYQTPPPMEHSLSSMLSPPPPPVPRNAKLLFIEDDLITPTSSFPPYSPSLPSFDFIPSKSLFTNTQASDVTRPPGQPTKIPRTCKLSMKRQTTLLRKTKASVQEKDMCVIINRKSLPPPPFRGIIDYASISDIENEWKSVWVYSYFSYIK